MSEKMKIVKWLLLLPLIFSIGEGIEVMVNTPDGEMFVLDVNPEDTMQDVQEWITSLTHDEAFIVSVPMKVRRRTFNAHNPTFSTPNSGDEGQTMRRNYLAEVSSQERADIHFIVTSLANKSLISISFLKGDLQSAGDRIDHVHPLRFLMTIFTDEEMKVGIRNLRGRGWIWGHFIGGLKTSLSVETHNGNMKAEYIAHFAERLQLDVAKIFPAISAQNWDGLIEILIREIPRRGDHDRYDN